MKTLILVTARWKSKSAVSYQPSPSCQETPAFHHPDPGHSFPTFLMIHDMFFLALYSGRRRHVISLHKVLKVNHEQMKEKWEISLHATNVRKFWLQVKFFCIVFLKSSDVKIRSRCRFQSLPPECWKTSLSFKNLSWWDTQNPNLGFKILSMPTGGYKETLRSLVLVTNHIPLCALAEETFGIFLFLIISREHVQDLSNHHQWWDLRICGIAKTNKSICVRAPSHGERRELYIAPLRRNRTRMAWLPNAQTLPLLVSLSFHSTSMTRK